MIENECYESKLPKNNLISFNHKIALTYDTDKKKEKNRKQKENVWRWSAWVMNQMVGR